MNRRKDGRGGGIVPAPLSCLWGWLRLQRPSSAAIWSLGWFKWAVAVESTTALGDCQSPCLGPRAQPTAVHPWSDCAELTMRPGWWSRRVNTRGPAICRRQSNELGGFGDAVCIKVMSPVCVFVSAGGVGLCTQHRGSWDILYRLLRVSIHFFFCFLEKPLCCYKRT